MLIAAGSAMAQSTGNDIARATKSLFDAVEDNDMSAAQISIARGGDINAINDWGLTPVDLAVDKGHFKIVHYLLSVREIRKSSRVPPPPPPIVSAEAPLAPAPAPAPVAKVYSPPPGSDPWSATVVTSEPTPPPVKTGPSPFDAIQTAPKPLPIVGEVRGQEPPVAPPPQTAAMTVTPPHQTAALTLSEAAQITPPPVPVAPKPVKQAIIHAPTPPVSPPGVTGPPPRIEGKLLPDAVEGTPLTDLPIGELQSPQVMPVAIAPTEDEKENRQPESTPKTIERPQSQPSPQQLPQPEVMAEETRAEPIGRTTPPGKPQVATSWFDQFKSFFSFESEQSGKDDDTEKTGADNTESGDWRVKEIEQAQLIPRPTVKKNQAVIPKRRLDGVILTLGRTTSLGKTPPPQAPAPWFYKSCINKRLSSIIFCIEPLDWPDEIETKFITDSVMYEGAQTIVRYDEGSATYFHTLFPSTSYSDIVDFFTRRYGPPTQVLNRSIAPLAAPRMSNPTVMWQSRAPVTNLLTTLEIRLYDDARGSFPDTKRGAIYLYHEWSQPVFPQLSSVELMLLRADEKTR